MLTALIVLGHGSKVKEATDNLAAITALVREKSSYHRVEYASLQFSAPGLSEVVGELAHAGVKRIFIAPYLLATGQHVMVDIPAELDLLRHKYSELELYLAAPLGVDHRLADLVLDRVAELEQGL
jgi:sirohydrochlorin ferrochelatase